MFFKIINSYIFQYPNSALSAMFSGRHDIQKHNERMFIDRQGDAFISMINYLRNGKYPVFRDKNEEINFFEELNFWQIPIYQSCKIKKFFERNLYDF